MKAKNILRSVRRGTIMEAISHGTYLYPHTMAELQRDYEYLKKKFEDGKWMIQRELQADMLTAMKGLYDRINGQVQMKAHTVEEISIAFHREYDNQMKLRTKLDNAYRVTVKQELQKRIQESCQICKDLDHQLTETMLKKEVA